MSTRERSDVARNRRAILKAAAALYAEADYPATITMDDIAAAAGVGKGTVFRRFGDRAGLLRAVFDERIEALTEAIATGPPPLGPATPPRERIVAVLAAAVDFKVDNRGISRALEAAGPRPNAPSLFETPSYQQAHRLLSELLAGLVGSGRAEFCAHALLSLTRVDFIGHLIDDEGYTRPELQRLLIDHIEQIIGPANA
jgi:AcrR family transcriptional regulator